MRGISQKVKTHKKDSSIKMKWFKHLSKSRNDALIRDAISLFGLAGEHVFWRTIELLSDEFNPKTPGYGEFLLKSWSKNYEISTKKTIKILSFFMQKKRIFYKISGNGKGETIKLNCPKLKAWCDNWTQKNIKKTTKSLRSKDEATFHIEAEEETEEEVNNNNTCPQREIVDLFKSILPELPQPRIWDETRQSNLRARWREDKKRQDINWWKRLFKYMRDSDFLMGNVEPTPGRRRFVLTLDWLVKKSNLIKVIEGKYHRK